MRERTQMKRARQSVSPNEMGWETRIDGVRLVKEIADHEEEATEVIRICCCEVNVMG